MFNFGSAEAKALGLVPAHQTAVDGYVGFDPSIDWSFSSGAPSSPSDLDLIGVAEHEITEVMGRISDVGTGNYSVMDLFRYSAPEFVTLRLIKTTPTRPPTSRSMGAIPRWAAGTISREAGIWGIGPRAAMMRSTM